MSSSHSIKFIDGATISVVNRIMVDIALVIGGSLIIALCGQIRIPLPFTPVPITGQTFSVLLLPILLRSWRGPAAVAVFLIQGATGLPFFAGGASGIGVLSGPTGGYLIGFLAAAILIGILTGKRELSRWRAAVSMIFGNIAIYLFGVAWLVQFIDGGIIKAILIGMVPFLLGDAIKLIGALLFVPKADGSVLISDR